MSAVQWGSVCVCRKNILFNKSVVFNVHQKYLLLYKCLVGCMSLAKNCSTQCLAAEKAIFRHDQNEKACGRGREKRQLKVQQHKVNYWKKIKSETHHAQHCTPRPVCMRTIAKSGQKQRKINGNENNSKYNLNPNRLFSIRATTNTQHFRYNENEKINKMFAKFAREKKGRKIHLLCVKFEQKKCWNNYVKRFPSNLLLLCVFFRIHPPATVSLTYYCCFELEFNFSMNYMHLDFLYMFIRK